MITVHHLGASQSERIVWLCEELGIPYEFKFYRRDPVTSLAPAEYRALHPMGTAPVISDGDLVLPESGAIIEYILATYGNGRLSVKPGKPEFADYVYWFHFANASLVPTLMVPLILGLANASCEGSPVLTSLMARSDKAFAMMEKRLGESPYFAGDKFTAADIIMYFPLTTMRVFTQIDLADFPNLDAYLQRIAERPAWQRAMTREKSEDGQACMIKVLDEFANTNH